MKGATADPLENTISPPIRNVTIKTGSKKNFFLIRINFQSSIMILIYRFLLKLIGHALPRISRAIFFNPICLCFRIELSFQGIISK